MKLVQGLLSAITMMAAVPVMATLAMTIVVAGGTADPASAQKRGGTMVYGVKAAPETYDVHTTNAYGVMHFLPQHYSTLLTFDWARFPVLKGDVAESWDVSDDALTYTFRIRKGIRFHDGTPLTSVDVKATYDRLRDPPKDVVSPRYALFSSIDTITTPDDHTVIFRLKDTDGFIMQGFGSPYNVIYSARDIAKGPKWHHKNINGTGPFRFVEHIPGEKWVAKRYKAYHFDDVYLDGTVAYRIKNILNPMLGGQIMAEWRAAVPPVRKSLEEKMGDKVTFQTMPMLSEMMITLNANFEPFKDQRVRHALTLCIDRYNGIPNLAKITWTAPEVSGHLLPGSQWALSPKELETIPGFGRDIAANRARAKKLLEEAGHSGLKFKYSNRAVSHPYDQIAIFMIAQWKACGLNPELESSPTPKWVSMRRSGGFDVTIDFNSNFLPDPTLMLQKHLSKDRSPQNYAGYTDRKLDALYDAQKKEADPAKRKELVQAFERRALEMAYMLPISYMNRSIALDARIKGYEIAPSLVLNTDWRGVWLDQ